MLLPPGPITRTVLSVQPTTMRERDGALANVTASGRQAPVSIGRVCINWLRALGREESISVKAPCVRHTRMARSSGPPTAKANRSPSMENATPLTGSVICTGNWNCSFQVSVFQMRAVLSALPDASSLPSGEKARPEIQSVWPLNSSAASRVSRFQTRTMESVPPVASHLPSVEKATASISSLACWISVIAPDSRSSNATVPERPAMPAASASVRPSLLNATARTWPESPPTLRTSCPVAASHRRTSLYPPETSVLLSGENASAVTGTFGSAAESARQRRNDESAGLT